MSLHDCCLSKTGQYALLFGLVISSSHDQSEAVAQSSAKNRRKVSVFTRDKGAHALIFRVRSTVAFGHQLPDSYFLRTKRIPPLAPPEFGSKRTSRLSAAVVSAAALQFSSFTGGRDPVQCAATELVGPSRRDGGRHRYLTPTLHAPNTVTCTSCYVITNESTNTSA